MKKNNKIDEKIDNEYNEDSIGQSLKIINETLENIYKTLIEKLTTTEGILLKLMTNKEFLKIYRKYCKKKGIENNESVQEIIETLEKRSK